jgi:hypothetical protein
MLVSCLSYLPYLTASNNYSTGISGIVLRNTTDRVQTETRLGVVILAVDVLWKVALFSDIKIDPKKTSGYSNQGQNPGIYLPHRTDRNTALTLTAGYLPTPCNAMSCPTITHAATSVYSYTLLPTHLLKPT